jgi:hypothetical protein
MSTEEKEAMIGNICDNEEELADALENAISVSAPAMRNGVGLAVCHAQVHGDEGHNGEGKKEEGRDGEGKKDADGRPSEDDSSEDDSSEDDLVGDDAIKKKKELVLQGCDIEEEEPLLQGSNQVEKKAIGLSLPKAAAEEKPSYEAEDLETAVDGRKTEGGPSCEHDVEEAKPVSEHLESKFRSQVIRKEDGKTHELVVMDDEDGTWKDALPKESESDDPETRRKMRQEKVLMAKTVKEEIHLALFYLKRVATTLDSPSLDMPYDTVMRLKNAPAEFKKILSKMSQRTSAQEKNFQKILKKSLTTMQKFVPGRGYHKNKARSYGTPQFTWLQEGTLNLNIMTTADIKNLPLEFRNMHTSLKKDEDLQKLVQEIPWNDMVDVEKRLSTLCRRVYLEADQSSAWGAVMLEGRGACSSTGDISDFWDTLKERVKHRVMEMLKEICERSSERSSERGTENATEHQTEK